MTPSVKNMTRIEKARYSLALDIAECLASRWPEVDTDKAMYLIAPLIPDSRADAEAELDELRKQTDGEGAVTEATRQAREVQRLRAKLELYEKQLIQIRW